MVVFASMLHCRCLGSAKPHVVSFVAAALQTLERNLLSFAKRPPWGDRTNHGGGWVVGETRVRGLYSRNAANGTPRAAPEATSFWPGTCLESGDLEPSGHVRTLGHLLHFRHGGRLEGRRDLRLGHLFMKGAACKGCSANTLSAMSSLLRRRGLVVALSIFHATA